MEPQFEQTFDKEDFSENQLKGGDYECCTFSNCDFSNADLSETKFMECEFTSCNLSSIALIQTVFQDVKFMDCKMLGLHFEDCSDFGLAFTFKNCLLNHSSFYKTKVKKIIFKNCQLQEVDFTESDLTEAIFDNCDLFNATFDRSILEEVDFKSSFNYVIDPEINQIRKAKFSLSGISGLLVKHEIEIS